MAFAVEKTTSGRECKVKDMSQADFARLELELAEVEMPGLMACRAEFGPSQPFKGARITGSLHMTIQTGVLIETLTPLGAEVRWCARNIFSTQDHATAAIARDSAAVFAWKGETLQEYSTPDLIVEDGGDATQLIHEDVKADEIFEKTGKVPAQVKGKKSNQEINASISSCTPVVFLVGSMYALIDVKDQFEDHTIHKWISVIALLIFCFLDATMKTIVDKEKCWASRYSKIIEGFSVVTGGILSVSLLSVFLSVPDRFSWLYVGIWLFLALIVARQFFTFLYAWICWGVKKMFCCLQNVAQSNPSPSEDVSLALRCFA